MESNRTDQTKAFFLECALVCMSALVRVRVSLCVKERAWACRLFDPIEETSERVLLCWSDEVGMRSFLCMCVRITEGLHGRRVLVITCLVHTRSFNRPAGRLSISVSVCMCLCAITRQHVEPGG